ncbi:MAG TPA: hypothetical protein VL354_19555 [Spirochaetia bacterium]|nr:hypothetical protein [Spirochaetia bacterium]
MPGRCTEKHLATLRQRYGEKRLREAATRREHLNYQRIHIGDGPGSGRVKFLLAQMHQTYYFGFSESACILAGTVLEQALIHRLEGWMARSGPLAFMKAGEKRWLQTKGDLLELELVDMLDLARAEGIIRDGRSLLLAHEIRWIRNMVVHEKIPTFHSRDEKFLELTVSKSRRGRVRYAKILLEKEEVRTLVDGVASRPPEPAEQHDVPGNGKGGARRARSSYRGGAAAQLTAYFCVSRVRMILRGLFNEPTSEGKTSNESGGSLLLWQES